MGCMDPRAPVDADALRAALAGRWGRVAVVAETASTNADLLDDATAPDRSVLVAEHQLAGRGRLDRSWVSPPGAGLTFSVLLRPAVPLEHWGWLPLLAGVALHEAVGALSGAPVALKWPNDLLAGAGVPPVSYSKVAGVLAQTNGAAVVVGIGLNVSTTQAELPPGATSLALCGAVAVDRGALLAAILGRLDSWVARWVEAGGDAEACGLAPAYRVACATIGQLVAVSGTDGGLTRGEAVGIDAIGRLQVLRDGAVRTIGAGDVEHVRPAG
jgi:BirA family transcriptional regulator, biotin operon repressor / biotin---[acetyl-CoA-carboxylase] ligase